MTDAERRFTSVPVEVRAGSEEKQTIGGYAAKFDRTSRNLGGFKERIDSRAFNVSRGDNWPGVIARYNHDDNIMLGRTSSGTLRLALDDVGLRYEVDTPLTLPYIYELVQRRDVNQSSFAFIAIEDDWAADDTGFPLRTLATVRLLDVSPVNTPAYEDTSVGVAGALDSLARKFSADPAEVRKLSDAGDLMRFFKRTDGPAPKTSSAALALARTKLIDPNPLKH